MVSFLAKKQDERKIGSSMKYSATLMITDNNYDLVFKVAFKERNNFLAGFREENNAI